MYTVVAVAVAVVANTDNHPNSQGMGNHNRAVFLSPAEGMVLEGVVVVSTSNLSSSFQADMYNSPTFLTQEADTAQEYNPAQKD